MVIRNPSEYVRLEEEMEALWLDLKRYLPKSDKERILGEIRAIERNLEIPHKAYNGG